MPTYNLRTRSEMENEATLSLSEEIKSYFAELISPLVTTEGLKKILEDFKEDFKAEVFDRIDE